MTEADLTVPAADSGVVVPEQDRPEPAPAHDGPVEPLPDELATAQLVDADGA